MAARQYPLGSSEYKILEEIGQGVSAVVYRALCVPFNEVVAVKSLDLERCNSNLDDIRREAQTMSLINHPNVVKSYCSFVVDCNLWVVMPYMAGGSCLHIMKAAYPDGFEETIIATFLKESLKALEYLHRHGHIHRDVKAGNILVAANGGVKLADFGVSACMFDMGDRQRSRNTFVGTPCWMAPEVMEQLHGYDFKADIWSLGITALELAHGHAPFSKYPPMKVLLMTLQNAPPGLDYERDKRFSKSFKEMIAMCLVKDPTKRPTAEKLLKHSFFKHAKSPDYVLRRVLDGLPPLWERVKTLKIKEAARLAQKKMPYEQQEELSQSEYKRGVSAWNFDLEDLKAQASLIQDDDGMSGEMQSVPNSPCTHEANGIGSEDGSCTDLYTANGSPDLESAEVEEEVDSATKSPLGQENLVGQKSDDREKYEWDQRRTNSNQHAGRQWSSSPLVPERVIDGERNRLSSRAGEDITRVRDRASSGPLTSNGSMLECRMANGSSALARSSLGNNDGGEDESNGVVQRKGRFSVFSAGVGQKEDVVTVLNARKPVASSIHKSASVGDWSQEKRPTVPSPSPLSTLAATTSSLQVPAAILLPQLQNLLSQTKAQKDVLMNIMASISTGDYSAGFTSTAQRTSQNNSRNYSRTSSSNSDNSPDTWSERERDFMQQVVDLKGRVSLLVDELQATKLRNVQLERQLNAIYNKEEEERIRREEAEREDG